MYMHCRKYIHYTTLNIHGYPSHVVLLLWSAQVHHGLGTIGIYMYMVIRIRNQKNQRTVKPTAKSYIKYNLPHLSTIHPTIHPSIHLFVYLPQDVQMHRKFTK